MSPPLAAIDWNIALNVAALIGLAIATVRVGGSRRNRGTIEDLEKAIAAKDARIDTLEEDVAGLGRRADVAQAKATECEKAVARWEARYQELSRYTAAEAVKHFEQMMADHSALVSERHARMIGHLEMLTEAQKSNNELMLKVVELVSATDQRVGEALKRAP